MNALLDNAWLIPILPLLAFVLTGFTPLRRNRQLSAWLATSLMALSMLMALAVLLATVAGAGHEAVAHTEEAHFVLPAPVITHTVRWAPAGDSAITMGYTIDTAIALMLAMVTIASTCIHMFSIGYMAHDNRQARFFSFIALFTAAMLTMIMSSNLLLFFMAWEVMGLCSYLLIGFWYSRDYHDPRQITPRQAAIKAFITTRIGDVLLMLGIGYAWMQAGSLDFGTQPGQLFAPDFLERIASQSGWAGMSVASGIALLLFCGTIGKSAQLPLHVWLPDAMEGPTPVSALIHAATMVAAGVFLVARTYPIFEASSILPLVTAIGAFTALFAALIATAQFDIKRILAYSTLSQLGFMVAALGLGGSAAWTAALFHLLTHAFFKALLFLGAGSVIHGMEATVGHDPNRAQDIRNMGGMRRFMPITFVTYLIGTLALMGIVPFAGFWSKDEILATSLSQGNLIVFAILLFSSLLTAFYMTRQVLLVFFGPFRSAALVNITGHRAAEGHDGGHEPHESPNTMTVPLILLALLAFGAGFVNFPGMHWLSTVLGQPAHDFNIIVATIASAAAVIGIGLGFAFYRSAFNTANDVDPMQTSMPAAFKAFGNRLYADELYAAVLGRLINSFDLLNTIFNALIETVLGLFNSVSSLFGKLNYLIDDGFLNDGAEELARATTSQGNRVRQLGHGRVQEYMALGFAGLVLLSALYLYVWVR